VITMRLREAIGLEFIIISTLQHHYALAAIVSLVVSVKRPDKVTLPYDSPDCDRSTTVTTATNIH